MRRALITGAFGFIGTALNERLTRRGVEVVAVGSGAHLAPADRCRRLGIDVSEALTRGDIDVIFHLAGSGVPFEAHEGHSHTWANEESTRALIESVEGSKWNGRIIFASSASTYGDTGLSPVDEDTMPMPITRYGLTKLAAERMLQDRLADSCNVVIARIFHVFGPGQRKLVVYDAARKMLFDKDVVVLEGNGDSARDFVYISDVTRTLQHLGEAQLSGALVVNVCSGEPTRIRSLAATLSQLTGRISEDIRFMPDRRPNPVNACVGDHRRLAALGIRLPGLSMEQLAETVAWIRRSAPNEDPRRQPVSTVPTFGRRPSSDL